MICIAHCIDVFDDMFGIKKWLVLVSNTFNDKQHNDVMNHCCNSIHFDANYM